MSRPPSPAVVQTAKRGSLAVAPMMHKAKHRLGLPPAAVTTVSRRDQPTTRPPSVIKASAAAVLPTPLWIAQPVAAQRPFVAELPQGHFAAPVAADPNRVGELRLRALIAADGSVKNVTVVSGDPKLAEAGMRAVRRWHYNPYEASATQLERETLINMKFFGQDAVSVTSVAR